jgi:hypothetical protein
MAGEFAKEGSSERLRRFFGVPLLSLSFSLCRAILCGVVLMAGVGCAMSPADFSRSGPIFDVQKFYTGHTRSTGVVETRGGKPLKPVFTETWGRMHNGVLTLVQDIRMGEEKPRRRVWQIRRVDTHRYAATTESVVGMARGESHGNAFRFSYTLALQPGNPLAHVRMTHWMYLQPDGRTMLNRVTVRKAGFVVAQISEVFVRSPRD